MYAKILTVAALAAVASAQLPAVARREFLEARQTDSGDSACQSAIASVLPIYSEIPIPPSDLQSATLPSDPCETPAFTGTLAAEYSSYTAEVLEWYTSNSAELLSALASCTELAAYATDVPVCSTLASEVISSASAYATASYDSASVTETETKTETGSDSSATGYSATSPASATKASASSSGTSAVATAGGARETGFAAGIVAAVGFVAAIAAL